MTVCVALLRGINVGGRQLIAMSALRDLLTRLGFQEARSVLQSGNLVFRSDGFRGAQLEHLLEAEALRRLSLETAFLVRTARELQAVIAANPYPREANRDPGRLLVQFLKQAPGTRAVKALQAAISGPEVVRVVGKHAYIVYPDGSGRSRLTNSVIEDRLGTRATARNWNTLLRLQALVAS